MILFRCIVIIIVSVSWTKAETKPCKVLKAKYGIVCVCTLDYCDTLEDIDPGDIGKYVLITSGKDKVPFTVRKGLFNESHADCARSPDNCRKDAHVAINRKEEFQTIIGFGGAFTGSVSYLLNKAPLELQQYIYQSYYSATKGIGFTMMRITIGGCDFDLEPWAYNELPINDYKLSNFTKLDARDRMKVEQIHNLINYSNNKDIKIVASAWSPPRWMKSNNKWNGFSTLKYDAYAAWAEYHVKFIELMAEKKLSIWAITTGNEPLNGIYGWVFVKFMSLGWLPDTQAKWIAQHLGPLIKNSINEDVRNVKIITGDDQRYSLPWWINRMSVVEPKAIDFIDGIGVHWYWDQIITPERLDKTHQYFPSKIILNTESSDGDKPFQTHGPLLGSWKRAEKYILAFMQDLNHWVNGWIDWNLILDENGGPNYVNNFVESAMIMNTVNYNEIYKQPIFYGMGHFSRWVIKDSVRIEATSDNQNVLVIAFKRPDETIVVIFYNKSKHQVNTKFSDPGRGIIRIEMPPKTVHTLHYKY